MGFTHFNCMLLGFTGFDLVLLGFYGDLLGFTEFYWVFREFLPRWSQFLLRLRRLSIFHTVDRFFTKLFSVQPIRSLHFVCRIIWYSWVLNYFAMSSNSIMGYSKWPSWFIQRLGFCFFFPQQKKHGSWLDAACLSTNQGPGPWNPTVIDRKRATIATRPASILPSFTEFFFSVFRVGVQLFLWSRTRVDDFYRLWSSFT